MTNLFFKFVPGHSNYDISFAQLILAAANSHSSDSEIATANFEFALDHFKSMHESTGGPSPDSLTYEFFLRTCWRLLPEGETRCKLAGRALSLCAKAGLVTAGICNEAAKSDLTGVLEQLDTTEETRRDLIGCIPDDWCRNVPKRRRKKEVNLGLSRRKFMR